MLSFVHGHGYVIERPNSARACSTMRKDRTKSFVRAFRGENEHFSSSADVLHKTSNLAIAGFHSRDQQPCFSTKTKGSVCIII